MNNPKVFIVILNWNGLFDTLECLKSVFKLDYPDFQVIVVDNGSVDNSVKSLREAYPEVIMIESKSNLGYSGGNNIGMKYAFENGGDYIWLLNNDTVVESDTLSILVNAAEKELDIGLVSPIIYYYNEPKKIQFCGSYVDWKNQTIQYPEITDRNLRGNEIFINGKEVCLWGTALLIKKNIVDKIGYIDERYFVYWEDTEYSLRALRNGYRNLVCISSNVYHKVLPSLTSISGIRRPHYYYFMCRNQYFLGMKYFSGRLWLPYVGKYLSNVLMTLLYLKNHNAAEEADACLDGVYAAFRGIEGPWNKHIKMPQLLKRNFHYFSSRHPYFWSALLKGDFAHIFTEASKRIKHRYANR